MTTIPVLKLILTTLGTTISALRLYLEFRRGRPPDASEDTEDQPVEDSAEPEAA